MNEKLCVLAGPASKDLAKNVANVSDAEKVAAIIKS